MTIMNLKQNILLKNLKPLMLLCFPPDKRILINKIIIQHISFVNYPTESYYEYFYPIKSHDVNLCNCQQLFIVLAYEIGKDIGQTDNTD